MLAAIQSLYVTGTLSMKTDGTAGDMDGTRSIFKCHTQLYGV